MAAYPVNFPVPNSSGYSVNTDIGMLSHKMDSGINRRRRIYNYAPSNIDINVTADTKTVNEMVDWFNSLEPGEFWDMPLVSALDAQSTFMNSLWIHRVQMVDDTLAYTRIPGSNSWNVSFRVHHKNYKHWQEYLTSNPVDVLDYEQMGYLYNADDVGAEWLYNGAVESVLFTDMESTPTPITNRNYPAGLPKPLATGLAGSFGVVSDRGYPQTMRNNILNLTYRMSTKMLYEWLRFVVFYGTYYHKQFLVSPLMENDTNCHTSYLRYISNPTGYLSSPDIWTVTIQAEVAPQAPSEGI